MTHKTTSTREVEKLRTQIQSMEEEIPAGSTSHATSSNKRRSKTKSSSPLSKPNHKSKRCGPRSEKLTAPLDLRIFSASTPTNQECGCLGPQDEGEPSSLHHQNRRTCVKGRKSFSRNLERHRGAWFRRTGRNRSSEGRSRGIERWSPALRRRKSPNCETVAQRTAQREDHLLYDVRSGCVIESCLSRRLKSSC